MKNEGQLSRYTSHREGKKSIIVEFTISCRKGVENKVKKWWESKTQRASVVPRCQWESLGKQSARSGAGRGPAGGRGAFTVMGWDAKRLENYR